MIDALAATPDRAAPTGPATADTATTGASGATTTTALEDEFATLACRALDRVTAERRRALFAFFEVRAVRAGSVLYRAGESPGFFVLVSGDVLLSTEPSHQRARRTRIVERGGVFGELARLDGQSLPESARADSAALVLLLPRARYDAAARQVPELRRVLDAVTRLEVLEPDFVAAMRRTRLFEDAGLHQISDLFHTAELLELAAGDVVVRQGAPGSGVYYVVEGELHSHCHEPPLLVDMLFPGDVFGDLPLVTGHAETITVSAAKPSTLVMLSAAQVRRHCATPSPSRTRASEAGGTTHVLMLLLGAGVASPAPLSVLTDLLAATLRREHGDQVAVLRLRPAARGDAACTGPRGFALDGDSVARAEVALGDGPAGAAAALVRDVIADLRAWLPRHGDASARSDHSQPPRGGDDVYVFLDATGLPRHQVEALSAVIGRLIFLSEDAASEPDDALGHLPTVHAALLGGGDRARSREAARGTGDGAPAFRSRSVRLRFDRAGLSAVPPRLEALSPAARAQFARWARAVTDRRVGVALGGGGAWGYAHVALIEALLDRGVPIDIVSGTSFGSVVGAYYCARGREGLEQLVRDGPKIARSTQLALISSSSLARVIDRALGGVALEELEVPLLPVATDVSAGTQHVPAVGTLGHGVRASGSFPGLFAPTTSEDGGRYVDGAMINNVPASVLYTHGAFLAVASNIIAQPAAMPAAAAPRFGRVGRALHELSPAGRARDLVRSLFILFHSMSDSRAMPADVTYEPEQLPHMPWEFDRGRAIIDHARASAERAADRAARRWEALRFRRALPPRVERP